MGHHWVPKYYLKGFATEDTDDRLWQFDKERGVFSTAPIPAAQIAQQRKYNESGIENDLANEIENPANPVLNKLRQGQQITNSEKRVFAEYLACMLYRVPNNRAVTSAMYPQVLEGLLDDVSSAIDGMKMRGASPMKVALRRAELIDAERNLRRTMPPEAINAINNPFPEGNITEAIVAMNWYLIEAIGEQRFVTSDDPMFVFRCWGVGNPKSEFCFPVSSQIGLFGSRYPAKFWLSYSSAHVDQTNERIVSDAGRFVYGDQQHDWIERYARTEPQQLKRLLPP